LFSLVPPLVPTPLIFAVIKCAKPFFPRHENLSLNSLLQVQSRDLGRLDTKVFLYGRRHIFPYRFFFLIPRLVQCGIALLIVFVHIEKLLIVLGRFARRGVWLALVAASSSLDQSRFLSEESNLRNEKINPMSSLRAASRIVAFSLGISRYRSLIQTPAPYTKLRPLMFLLKFSLRWSQAPRAGLRVSGVRFTYQFVGLTGQPFFGPRRVPF